MTPRLLIAGFDAFPGVPVNPAALVVERLERGAWAPEGVEARYAGLPTTWAGAFPALSRAVAKARATAVLILGVAGEAEAFRVEAIGRNRAGADKPDAAGATPPSARIAVEGPETAPAACRPDALVEAILAAGLDAGVSSDAGDYLCNHTFYRSLTELDDGTAVAFLHLPPLGPSRDLDSLTRAVKAAASALAHQPHVAARLRPRVAG